MIEESKEAGGIPGTEKWPAVRSALSPVMHTALKLLLISSTVFVVC